MSKFPNWTKEELDLLEKEYPRLGGCVELQKLFPSRPLQGITLKANRMGFKVVNNIRKAKTNEEYLAELEKTNFVPLEPYKGSTTLILHMCGICDHEWLARPQNILRVGARCPICDIQHRKDSAYSKVREVLKSANMEQVSNYTGALDKITLKHTVCGYVWDTVYSYIQQGSGCPCCNIGFGSRHSEGAPPARANIYLFKVVTSTDSFYKIGITSREVSRRAIELRARIPDIISLELLYEVEDSGLNIIKKERQVLMSTKGFTPDTKFEGSTELLHLTTDINIVKEIMNENI